MLNMTKVELELIPDPDMYIFFEIGTRGGVSYISNRCSKANNKGFKFYHPKQESKHNIYLEVNNLYGYAMAKFFPTNEFKWIDLKVFDPKKYTTNITSVFAMFKNQYQTIMVMKNMLFIMKTLLEARIKTKNNASSFKFNQSQCLNNMSNSTHKK